ncbi:putative mechanosensitive ion channel MscS, LSM domain-containing protein [Rosa chinensis]|uniref:Mechanosensitive ion channel protein n=1 Tax=Rosa chinensis TaxID=74649 RepID=A0A2P6SCW8_ROSCH|nr:mechanosensitive ion channel protein 10 isoform X1 [Rosa chinensis]PRQ56525.1 putative mechanosensitive ion channel MscS, LSM domain-containing protein [Rosa chinensis]
MEFQKSNIDHVVVSIDQPSPKLNQSPQADSIPQSPQSIAKPLRRLNFSKPRSRFEENKHPVTPRTILQSEEHEPLNTNEDNYSSSSDDEEWFENEEDDQEEEGNKRKQGNKRKRKMNKRALIEWTLFLIIMTCLVCSLTVDSLKHEMKWGLQVWKWCLMVLVMFCGRLVSGWVVGFIVFLIERNFMLREKVLYFVFGLRKSFQNCAWLALVLVAWVIMFPHVDKQSKVLKKVFRALIAVLIGATIWLLKIVFVKVLASSFHVATFFDRMKESVFHHFILDALSGPPMDLEERDHLSQRRLQASKTLPARLRRDKSSQLTKSRSCKQDGSRTIDMEKLKKLSMPGRATAWSVKRLVSYVRSSGLSTMVSSTMDDFGNTESEITSEWEARNSAQRIFKNVAKPGAKYIEEEDLLRFLKTDEIHTIFPLFEGATETGRITKASFRNWVVHAYIERRALAHSLNDTKTAVQQLHKLASAVVIVIITVVSLLVMGLATTKVIFVVTSQLLLVGFMFQNMCKTMFESIIFVFVMHPFDVGDRCVVDGVQMIVEEMNILTTVFLRYDNEKIYYPNSVLLTKPISNFRRSPDMGDSVDFTIDVSTPVDDVTALKKAIQSYIESKPKHWNPKHSVIVKDIVNVDKMKMLLCVQHTMNHQNYGEKSVRRSELVFELKRIFQNLGIKYHLLPQEVNIPQFNKSTGLINRD